MPATERWMVSFSRQASDGNYGSETIRIERTLIASDGEILDELHAAQALASCRAIVHTELTRSPSWRVRDAVDAHEIASTTATTGDDAEDLPY